MQEEPARRGPPSAGHRRPATVDRGVDEGRACSAWGAGVLAQHKVVPTPDGAHAAFPPTPLECALPPHPVVEMSANSTALISTFFGADDGIRTRDPHLGKVMLYQLSHVRVVLTP
jgi:hypothetical protein